jgi:hypothetical protein
MRSFGHGPVGMDSTASMRLIRFMSAVLFGLLLGWGGFAMPEAAMTAMPHHAMAAAEGALPDCDEQPGHHEHGDHQDQSDHEDHSKLSHQGCCAMACSMSALEPTDLQVNPIEWTPARVQIAADDMLRDRSVSPLRRPPRAAA